MKVWTAVCLLGMVLAVAPGAGADDAAFCRTALDGLLKTMREAPVLHNPAKEKHRLKVLRDTERHIVAGRKKGQDECEMWRRISAEVATE